jgi:hypothetical protein
MASRPPSVTIVEEIKQEDPVVQEYLGVEQVIKLALQAKKPLVAHNMIYDILFLVPVRAVHR